MIHRCKRRDRKNKQGEKKRDCVGESQNKKQQRRHIKEKKECGDTVGIAERGGAERVICARGGFFGRGVSTSKCEYGGEERCTEHSAYIR